MSHEDAGKNQNLPNNNLLVNVVVAAVAAAVVVDDVAMVYIRYVCPFCV